MGEEERKTEVSKGVLNPHLTGRHQSVDWHSLLSCIVKRGLTSLNAHPSERRERRESEKRELKHITKKKRDREKMRERRREIDR